MASIGVRTNRDGSTTWRVNFRIDGTQCQESFRIESGATQFKALVERVGGKAAREVLAARQRRDDSVPLLGDFVEKFLDEKSGMLTNVTAGTRADYQRMARRSFFQTLGEVPLNALTPDSIGQWMIWQGKQGQAPKTIKNYHSVLSQSLSAAVDRGLLERNVAYGVELPEGEVEEARALTHDEFDTLYDVIRPRHQPLVRFLVDSGLRWSEATALQWKHVQGTRIRVRRAWKKSRAGRIAGPPKSKAGRRDVDILQSTFDLLPARGAAEDLVFPSLAGTPLWHAHFYERAWKPAVEKAFPGETLRIHDLRHTCATWLLMAGVPIHAVQRRMGHESIETTARVYAKVQPMAATAILNGLTAALDKQQ